MSGIGIFVGILVILFSTLLTVALPVLLAGICFYAFWYAVKNSPTLRTRRFVISAALDTNILLWLLWSAMFFLGRYWLSSSDTLHLPSNLQIFFIWNLPTFLVLSVFLTYIVLRWHWILYEDRGKGAGDEALLRTNALGTGITFFRNLFTGYRNSCLTANGLRIKRNIVIGLISPFLVFYTVECIQTNLQNIGLIIYFSWKIILAVGVQAVFFWIVSKAFGISQDETALEQSPPKIPLSQWNEEELRPEKQRQMLMNIVFFVAAIPFMLLLVIFGSGIIQENLLSKSYNHASVSYTSIRTLIGFQVALVVLTVLWSSHNPTKRMTGFALLFLLSGLLAFFTIEWMPLYLITFFYLGGSTDQSTWEMFAKGCFSRHLAAGTFLVYSLLASTFCWINR